MKSSSLRRLLSRLSSRPSIPMAMPPMPKKTIAPVGLVGRWGRRAWSMNLNDRRYAAAPCWRPPRFLPFRQGLIRGWRSLSAHELGRWTQPGAIRGAFEGSLAPSDVSSSCFALFDIDRVALQALFSQLRLARPPRGVETGGRHKRACGIRRCLLPRRGSRAHSARSGCKPSTHLQVRSRCARRRVPGRRTPRLPP